MTTVRTAAVAGQFYPADPSELRATVGRLISECTADPVPGAPVALISPHAGYIYSGRTAAECFRTLKGRTPEIVAIISPSHREYFEGISVYRGSAYVTPLGPVAVDAETRDALAKNDAWIFTSEAGHGGEHALEVQLPFLQVVLGEARIVPIVMGDQRPGYCRHLGHRLADTLRGRDAVIVASTDLSHYHTYDEAERLDTRFAGLVERFDTDALMEDLENRTLEACGGGPAVAALLAAKRLGADSVTLLHRCNSGDVTGDRSGVVGYLSAVAYRHN